MRVLASVTTGLEGIARNEITDKLGALAVVDASQRAGSLRLSAPSAALPQLTTLRVPGQLTLLVHEDARFFSGREDEKGADLGRLRELGSSVEWAAAVALRRALLPAAPAAAGDDSTLAGPVRFRVTCKRTTAVDGRDVGVKHGFTSVNAAAEVGGAISHAVEGWSVSLKDFDVEIVLTVGGRELTLGLKAGECGSRAARAGGAGGLMLGKTALKVALAHAMNRLALGQYAGDGGGMIQLDPMCGSGCLGLEAATHWPGTAALGGDVDAREVKRLGRSLAALRKPPKRVAETSERTAERSAAVRCDAALWDAANLPLRTGAVDSVATDLPWGQKWGSKEDNGVLYPKALREFGRVLRPGGTCVVLTADRKAMQGAMAGGWVEACFSRISPLPAGAAATAAEAALSGPAALLVQPEPELEAHTLIERAVGEFTVSLRANTSDELVYREIYEESGYEQHGVTPKGGDVWIDLGSHMGLFTFRALQLGAKHVHCYEPNPQNFELLKRNVEANAEAIGGRVTLHNEAVDATGGGDKPLFLAHRPHRQGQTNNYRHSLLSVAPGGSDRKTASVAVATTSFAAVLARHPDATAVKMDIEGAEIGILTQQQAWGAVERLCFEYTCKSGELGAIERALVRGGGFKLSYAKELLLHDRGSDGVVFCSRDPSAARVASIGQTVADAGPEPELEPAVKAFRAEPDHLVNVSGKFAGLWVLIRTQAAWPEVLKSANE